MRDLIGSSYNRANQVREVVNRGRHTPIKLCTYRMYRALCEVAPGFRSGSLCMNL
jgi:hypothetical protein